MGIPSSASMVGRRDLLQLSAVAACGLVQHAATSPSGVTAAPSAEVPVTPPEDLMREHGVLKRLLLVYREVIRRVASGDQLPAQELHAAARIVREFVEDYHEKLEERYVFPRLRSAGKL